MQTLYFILVLVLGSDREFGFRWTAQNLHRVLPRSRPAPNLSLRMQSRTLASHPTQQGVAILYKWLVVQSQMSALLLVVLHRGIIIFSKLFGGAQRIMELRKSNVHVKLSSVWVGASKLHHFLLFGVSES